MTTNTTEPDFVARHAQVRQGFRDLHRAVPETMAGFGALHRAAMAEGALSAATKELIALAIGITSQCDGCIAFHVHDALDAGASREEICETISVAVLMGGGPAAVYATEALTALDQFERELA